MGIIQLQHVAPQTSQHSPQGGEQRFCVWPMYLKDIFDGILTVLTDLVGKLQEGATVIDSDVCPGTQDHVLPKWAMDCCMCVSLKHSTALFLFRLPHIK